MNSKNYVDFLQANFMQWFNRKSKSFKNKMIFMHDNAPSHAARVTSHRLTVPVMERVQGGASHGLAGSSPDAKCIENLWGLLKQRLYVNNKQYSSKPDLKVAIERKLRDIEESTIMKLTSSMDARIVKVLKANGEYIKM